MSFEGDANIKNSNENLVEAPTKLEDVQAKMERLREAMESVEEAIKALKNDEETVKSNTKQQGKEKKKKSKNKKGNDIAENVDATIGKSIFLVQDFNTRWQLPEILFNLCICKAHLCNFYRALRWLTT